MNNTAVEDLFVREETLNNAVCTVKGECKASELSSITGATSGDCYKLTAGGTVGAVTFAAGDFAKATVADSPATTTWSKASESDVKGFLESAVRDWKRWGRDVSKDLGIAVWLHNADKLAAGALTVKLESSSDKAAWNVIASASGSVSGTDSCARLAFFLLPRTGIKQYVRVKAEVTTQFTDGTNATAPVVSIGLENDGDNDIDLSMAQPKIGG